MSTQWELLEVMVSSVCWLPGFNLRALQLVPY